MASGKEQDQIWLAALKARTGLDYSAMAKAVGLSHTTLTRVFDPNHRHAMSMTTRRKLIERFGDVDDGPSQRDYVVAVETLAKLLKWPVPELLRASQGGRQANIDSPHNGKLVKEPRQLELLKVWSALPEDRQVMALKVLRSLLDTASDADVFELG